MPRGPASPVAATYTTPGAVVKQGIGTLWREGLAFRSRRGIIRFKKELDNPL